MDKPSKKGGENLEYCGFNRISTTSISYFLRIKYVKRGINKIRSPNQKVNKNLH